MEVSVAVFLFGFGFLLGWILEPTSIKKLRSTYADRFKSGILVGSILLAVCLAITYV